MVRKSENIPHMVVKNGDLPWWKWKVTKITLNQQELLELLGVVWHKTLWSIVAFFITAAPMSLWNPNRLPWKAPRTAALAK